MICACLKRELLNHCQLAGLLDLMSFGFSLTKYLYFICKLVLYPVMVDV